MPPCAKGRPRISTFGGFARAYTPKKTRDSEKEFKEQLEAQLPRDFRPFTGALKVTITFSKERPKHLKKSIVHLVTKSGDLDNFLKWALDSMNEIIFVDDSQIIEIHARKEYGTDTTTIEVEEYAEPKKEEKISTQASIPQNRDYNTGQFQV